MPNLNIAWWYLFGKNIVTTGRNCWWYRQRVLLMLHLLTSLFQARIIVFLKFHIERIIKLVYSACWYWNKSNRHVSLICSMLYKIPTTVYSCSYNIIECQYLDLNQTINLLMSTCHSKICTLSQTFSQLFNYVYKCTKNVVMPYNYAQQGSWNPTLARIPS